MGANGILLSSSKARKHFQVVFEMNTRLLNIILTGQFEFASVIQDDV